MSFLGKLSPPGTATGTLRLDMTMNVQDVGTVVCTTGDLTWNSGAQAKLALPGIVEEQRKARQALILRQESR